MSKTSVAYRPALHCFQNPPGTKWLLRGFASAVIQTERLSSQPATLATPATPGVLPAASDLNPELVSTRSQEQLLIASGKFPIGSRRRRAALSSTQNIPFEQLPYQCFQEARKILQTDREEKLKQIETERKRIAYVQAKDGALQGGEASKKGKLVAMQKHLEKLKIMADINDPIIKKRHEDGLGDMNRPIYRYLADRGWREYKRKVLVQRITQMSVVPDVLPHIDPTADVKLSFGKRNVQSGDFVDSRVSEIRPHFKVQVFDKDERLVTIAVIDSDVPNVEIDAFDFRCHYLAANIPLSPTSNAISLARLSKTDNVVFDWLPPHAQKGSPYHRLSIFVLQQPHGKSLDIEDVQKRYQRHGFNLRSFIDVQRVKPIGVQLFRSQWDEGTAGVMKRAGLEGANIELKRKKPEKLPYKKKDGARYR